MDTKMADIILYDDDPELLEIKEENARLFFIFDPNMAVSRWICLLDWKNKHIEEKCPKINCLQSIAWFNSWNGINMLKKTMRNA